MILYDHNSFIWSCTLKLFHCTLSQVQCCFHAGCNVIFLLQLSSIVSGYSDSGLFGVQAVSTPQNIGKVS